MHLIFILLGNSKKSVSHTQNGPQTEGTGQEPRPSNSVLLLCYHTVSVCCVLCRETLPIWGIWWACCVKLLYQILINFRRPNCDSLVLSLPSIYCCAISAVREVSCFPLTSWVRSVRGKEQQDNSKRGAQGAMWLSDKFSGNNVGSETPAEPCRMW